MTNDKTQNKRSIKKRKLAHDALFKRIMENDIAAKEFLDEYLPQEVKNIVDLNTINVEKESYIEPNLTKRLSDIVYRVNTKSRKKAFIYVVAEHQSSVDQLMPFRIWRYVLLLAERHIDTKGKIPLIFPIVVYAGNAKYTASRNLWALFEHPELAKKILAEDHALVDLQSMSDNEIAKKKHIALFEYVLKHIHMRDMMKLWKNIFEKFPDAVLIDKKHGYLYITNLLWYIDGNLSITKRDELSDLIIEHLPQEDGEEIMKTIADSYREEGINKGMLIGEARGEAIGIKKIVMRMLQVNTDVNYISSVTGLAIEEILKFKNEM